VVQWIVGIWLVKQIDQTVNDRVDVQDGSPILSQNIQTDLALQINVGMVNVRLALHFGWGVRIVRGDGKDKFIGGVLPIASIGSY
jgi:hypothetical protein